MRKKLYDAVIKELLEMMEKGEFPWRAKEWGYPVGSPSNIQSKRAYRGINALRLMAEHRMSRWWGTEAQIIGFGYKLKKRAKSAYVVSQFAVPDDEDGDDDAASNNIPIFKIRSRTYEVFSMDDVKGFVFKEDEIKPIERCEQFIARLPKNAAKVHHKGNEAMYEWGKDRIIMPPPASFSSAEIYYAVLFHEYAHSTGHKSRLERWSKRVIHKFSDDEILAMEEVIAEMTSAFICAQVQIHQKTLVSSAEYIDKFVKQVRSEPRAFLMAANMAQKSCRLVER